MTVRTWSLAFAAMAMAAPLAAQRDTVVLKRVPEGRGGQSGAVTITLSGRGRIGVVVSMRPGPNDSLGATVQSVTPGGPAAKAGIQGGDIITRLKGTLLVDRTPSKGRADDDDSPRSQPALKLLDLASGLSAGDTVAVEFRRGKERKTVQLVAADLDGMMTYSFSGDTGAPFFFRSSPGGSFRYGFRIPDPDDFVLGGRSGALSGSPLSPDQVFVRFGSSPLDDMEFAPVNPDLGRYFGVKEGILVLSVPDSSALPLKAGDVILSVGGRKPTSVSKLLEILQTYDDGESVTLDVVRDHKRLSVTGKADLDHPRWTTGTWAPTPERGRARARVRRPD